VQLRRRSESSFQQMQIEAIIQREKSLTEPRYGVSLVAGRPFADRVVDAMRDIQSKLVSIIPDGLIMADPSTIHATIFRGRSSTTPCIAVSSAPRTIATALGLGIPVELDWPEIRLDADGAIRAYASPPKWPFVSDQLALVAVEALSHVYNLDVFVQERLWTTLGTLRACACDRDSVNDIHDLLGRCSIPTTIVSRLSLLYYKDILLVNSEVLETYELH